MVSIHCESILSVMKCECSVSTLYAMKVTLIYKTHGCCYIDEFALNGLLLTYLILLAKMSPTIPTLFICKIKLIMHLNFCVHLKVLS